MSWKKLAEDWIEMEVREIDCDEDLCESYGLMSVNQDYMGRLTLHYLSVLFVLGTVCLGNNDRHVDLGTHGGKRCQKWRRWCQLAPTGSRRSTLT